MESRRSFRLRFVRATTAGVMLVLVFIVMSAIAVLGFWRPSVEQPIAFNHQKHVAELGMDCTECHQYATQNTRATIPNWTVCATCHEDPVTDSAEEARVVKYIHDEEMIPWQAVHWVPDHVYFSHRRHTAIAGIDCEVCHGPIREQSVPLTRPLRGVSMERCIDCHEDSGASTDCVSCHK